MVISLTRDGSLPQLADRTAWLTLTHSSLSSRSAGSWLASYPSPGTYRPGMPPPAPTCSGRRSPVSSTSSTRSYGTTASTIPRLSGATSVSSLTYFEISACLIRILAATKFLIGAAIGVPASSLCINRRLFKIASGTAVRVSPEQVGCHILQTVSPLTSSTETPCCHNRLVNCCWHSRSRYGAA